LRFKTIAINIVAIASLAGLCSSCSGSGSPDNANLSGLEISEGTLSPAFDKDTISYSAKVAITVPSVTLKSTAEMGEDTLITINDLPAISGKDSAPVLIYPGANTVTILVKSPDRTKEKTYTVIVNSVINELESILQGSDTGNSDHFGWSVACDGTTLVVGAPYASGGASGHGAVYIFNRVSSRWVQTQKLTATGGANGDLFGWSVSLSGNTIAVGAPYQSDIGLGQTNNGAVYIFTNSGGTWTQRTRIESHAPNAPCTSYYFGWSVSLQGTTLAVGEPNSPTYNGACTGSGGGYHGDVQMFTGSGASWTYGSTLTAGADDNPSNYFGAAISLDSGTLVISSQGYINVGVVYIFTGSGGTWTQQARLHALSPSINSNFGSSVSLSGERLVIGSETESTTKSNSGAVYLFAGSGTSWSQSGDAMKSSTPVIDEYFGHSVSLYGDFFAVGASGPPNPTYKKGSVTVFAKQKLFAFSQVEDPLTPAGAAASLARLGQSVAVTDTQIIVGADNYDLDGSGAVYVYH
jgi:hypothetical protein